MTVSVERIPRPTAPQHPATPPADQPTDPADPMGHLRIVAADTCDLTEYAGPVYLTRDKRVDADRTHIRCAAHRISGCENVVLIGLSVSYIACMATTGGTGLGSFILQCGEEQHFCCSPECALAAHAYCLLHHIRPAINAVFASRQSGKIAAADVAGVILSPASADDTDAARTIRQLRTRGQATGRAPGGKRLPPASVRRDGRKNAGQHQHEQHDDHSGQDERLPAAKRKHIAVHRPSRSPLPAASNAPADSIADGARTDSTISKSAV